MLRPSDPAVTAGVLLNIDVPDVELGERFYGEAFGLRPTRRFGEDGVEMVGWAVPIYLLRRPAGSTGADHDLRRYERHWCPVHVDVVVDDLDAALDRAVRAGAVAETEVDTAAWGRIVTLADPFGHGICLIQFLNRGYDEITTPA